MFARRFGSVVRQVAQRSVVTLPAARRPVPAPFVRAAGAASFSTSKLPEVLASELHEAQAAQNIDQDLADVTKLIKKSFTIHDETGDAVVKLTRKYKAEEITVEFHCQDENSDFNMNDSDFETSEEMPEMESGIDFTVTVSKPAGKVQFQCNAGSTITVVGMAITPSGSNLKEEHLYRGPTFDNLDEGLQDELLNYLAERGVDEDMALFVISYAREKEEKEYQNWLKNFMKLTE
jgi:complement component 1 Q subcomponent-binding protein